MHSFCSMRTAMLLWNRFTNLLLWEWDKTHKNRSHVESSTYMLFKEAISRPRCSSGYCVCHWTLGSQVQTQLWRWIFMDGKNPKHVRFQVLTAASMMFRVVFWDILPCKMVVDRRFRGDGGSTNLWNFDRQSFYTAVYPRRQLWTPEARLRSEGN
jgi:hypothetical protein